MAKPIAKIHSDGYWTSMPGFREPLNFASMEVYAAPQPPTASEPAEYQWRFPESESEFWHQCSKDWHQRIKAGGIADAETRALYDHPLPAAASSAISPSSKWPFEQPHVARDLLARLYAMRDKVVRDPKLEAEIDVFLTATRRP